MNPRLRNPGVGLLALALLWVALYWASGPGALRVPTDELDESGAVLVRQSEAGRSAETHAGGEPPEPRTDTRTETHPEARRDTEPRTGTREPTPPPPVGGARSTPRQAEADPPPAPPEPEHETYTVRSGDSLSVISQRLYGSARHWRLLYEANRDRIPDPDRLRLGTELRVPPLPDGGELHGYAWRVNVKRILVTGGAGFLGSHLCDRLVEQGHDVICLDNFFTSQKSNVTHLLGLPNFELLRHDVTHPIWLEVDQIYNLACPAAPGHYQYNPIKTMKTSVMGAINVLGMAKRCRARVLQASTSEIYGDPDVHPQPESYRGNVNPIGPRACYDEGKRAAETLFFDYHRANRVDIRVVRIFNTYGPRMHPFDGRVVSNFIRQVLEGEPITMFGDGSQTRSFCYVDDLVEGLIRMMNLEDGFIGPVNLGNPDEFTIRELAELTCELSGKKADFVFKPLPEDDPKQRRPDITLAGKHLGWKPEIPLREGLQATIDWFRTIDQGQYRAPTPNF